jgi:osmotically-inducible protein OsmY
MADHSHEQEATLAEPAISDLDLHRTIEEALWAIDSIRVTKPDLEVAAHNGRATVSGIVNSSMMRSEIAAALRGWPVELFLVDDGGIQNAAAYALATDARTRGLRPGYRVQSLNGQVEVRGNFSPEQTAAIQEVAGEVTGVKLVKVN